MRERRRRGSLRQECPDGLAFVESESGDIDQTGDIGYVGAEGGHDLPPARMTDNIGRTVLAIEHLAEPSHVIGQRALAKLRRSDVISVSLEPFYDVAPTRAVRPCSVDENDDPFASYRPRWDQSEVSPNSRRLWIPKDRVLRCVPASQRSRVRVWRPRFHGTPQSSPVRRVRIRSN
jgi:hypothetical protein